MGLKRVGHDLATNTPNTHTHLSSFILYILYIIFLKEGIETNKPKMGEGWDSADNETQTQEIKWSETNLFPTGPLNNTVIPGGTSGKEPTC